MERDSKLYVARFEKERKQRQKRMIKVGIILTIVVLIFIYIEINLRSIRKELNFIVNYLSQHGYEDIADAYDTYEDENHKFGGLYTLSDSIYLENPFVHAAIEDAATLEDTLETTEDLNVNSDIIDEKKDERKKVYLTFDDGPSSNTEKILDVLKKYDATATFFVVGKEDEHSLAMYQRIVDEGHQLAMHSYTHDYGTIYKSVKLFENDLNQIRDLLYNTTGVMPTVYRFPGGSSNTVSNLNMSDFIKVLNDEKVVYYDWNISSGDAEGGTIGVDEIVSNVMTTIDNYSTPVVLFHDANSKEATVKALKIILNQLKQQDMVAVAIDETINPVQHVK